MVRKDQTQSQLLKPLLVDKFAWGLLEEYLAAEKSRLVTLLVSCSPEELRKLQGELQGVQKLLDLPIKLNVEQKSTRG